MTDFALAFPRVAELALAYAVALATPVPKAAGPRLDNLDLPDPPTPADAIRSALVTACLADIPRDPWRASDRVVRLVAAVASAPEADPAQIHFDARGNGPFCQHGGIAGGFLCGECNERRNAEDALVEHVVHLARAS